MGLCSVFCSHQLGNRHFRWGSGLPLTFSSPYNLHKKFMSPRGPEVRLQGHSTWGTARHSSVLWGTGLSAGTGFQEGRPQQCVSASPKHTLPQRPGPSFPLDIYPFSLLSAYMYMCGIYMCKCGVCIIVCVCVWLCVCQKLT